MGPAPSLSAYQQAAASIYEPQKQAEAATLATEKQGTINTLESGKGQIATDYQSAVDNLNSVIKENIGKINQLYTERLAGNFSGLQGNDVGGMMAKGLQQQSVIEQTRANKLSEIAVQEANATNKYNTDIANLPSKYQSLENKYASDTYNSAVKQYSTDAYRQQQLGLSEARLSLQEQKQAQGKTPTTQDYSRDMGSFLTSKAGKDKYVSPQDFGKAFKEWSAQGLDPNTFITRFKQYINPSNKSYKYYLPGSVGDPLTKANNTNALIQQLLSGGGG